MSHKSLFYIVSIFFIFLIESWSVFADDPSDILYMSDTMYMRFSERSVEIYGDKSPNYHGPMGNQKYRIENRQGLEYLILGEETEYTYLMLNSPGIIYLYDGDNRPPVYVGSSVEPMVPVWLELGTAVKDWDASSFYQSGNESYPAKNLSDFRLFHPYCEGATGDGVGVTFTVHNTFYQLVFSNGFVSFERPDLFMANGRVKKLKVVALKTGLEKIIELKDTPNIQGIIMPDESGDYKFTILEVYPGEKYSDTCINFIN